MTVCARLVFAGRALRQMRRVRPAKRKVVIHDRIDGFAAGDQRRACVGMPVCVADHGVIVDLARTCSCLEIFPRPCMQAECVFALQDDLDLSKISALIDSSRESGGAEAGGTSDWAAARLEEVGPVESYKQMKRVIAFLVDITCHFDPARRSVGSPRHSRPSN